MTIEQLVKELSSPVFKGETQKIDRVKKHLKTDYIDYQQKMVISECVLQASRYREIDGKKVYSPSGPVEYKCKLTALIESYYDIKFRTGNDGAEQLEDFNLLEKNGISEILLKGIGDDLKRFDGVYNLMAADMAYKESIVPFLSTKFESLGMVMDTVTETMGQYGAMLTEGIQNKNDESVDYTEVPVTPSES